MNINELRAAINIILEKIDNEHTLKVIYRFVERMLLGE